MNRVIISQKIFRRAFFVLFLGLLTATELSGQTVITHNIATGSLTIPGSSIDTFIITGTTTANKVTIQSGYKGKVILRNLKITSSTAPGSTYGLSGYSCITVEGQNNCDNRRPVTIVDIILDGVDSLTYTQDRYCAFQVNQGAQIRINAVDTTNNASGILVARNTATAGGSNGGGAGIGAPNFQSGGTGQGTATSTCTSGSPGTTATAGGNIIIGSGTITAIGGHGAGIGGGWNTYYNGFIIIYGGIINANGQYHAAGIGSGCPSGSGVTTCSPPNSTIIALPPTQITACGHNTNLNQCNAGWELAGAKNITYINDPSKTLITVHTVDSTPNADIYIDLTLTPRLTNIFDSLGMGWYNLAAVKCGTTNAQGLFQFRAELQQSTTFFTDAGSIKPATLGRPYEPVSRTITGNSSNRVSVILPMLQMKIAFTDYPSRPLDEGYTAPEAQQHAFRTKVTYTDPSPMTNVAFSMQSGVDFASLIFLAADSMTVIPAPTRLDSGDVFYIVTPIKISKTINFYTDVLRITGTWKGITLSAPIRKVVIQRVVRLDISQTYIKVRAIPTSFTNYVPATQLVDVILNINHSGLNTIYDPANVIAKYLITTEINYAAAVASVPLNSWNSLNIPTADSVDRTTTLNFSSLPAGVYYIHWYVESGILYSNTQAIGIGDFGPYAICDTVRAGSISGAATICSGQTQFLTGTAGSGGCSGITYNWQTSLDGMSWSNVSGSNTQNHTSSILMTNTYFRRQTIDPILGAYNSNVVLITVTPRNTPAITAMIVYCSFTLNAQTDTICAGDSITIGTEFVHGGTLPQFQWFVNGSAVLGATDSIFTYLPANGDTVNCRMVSNESCVNLDTVFSPAVIITVNQCIIPLPDIYKQALSCIPSTIIRQAEDTIIHCAVLDTLYLTKPSALASVVNKKIFYNSPMAGFVGRDTVEFIAVCHDTTYSGKIIFTIIECPDNIDTSECFGQVSGFTWAIKEAWRSTQDSVDLYASPLVGDLDGDGIPEIVCFTNANRKRIVAAPNTNNTPCVNTIAIYDGKTHALKQTFTLPSFISEYDISSYGLVKTSTGVGLIVVATLDLKIYAYNINGTQVWASRAGEDFGTTPLTDLATAVGFADFNGDGHPEVYLRDKIYDAETGYLLGTASGGVNKGLSWGDWTHLSPAWKQSVPFAADVTGDGKLNLILGNEIYDVNITNRNSNTNPITRVKTIAPPAGVPADGHAQVADFNGDGHPDILITNRNNAGSTGNVYMYLWDVFNNTVSNAVTIPTNMSGKSIPLIADINNDGKLEVLIQCAATDSYFYRCYRYNDTTRTFVYLWGIIPSEDSYSTTATLFDFNQDGMNEVLLADQTRVRIFNGSGKSHKTGADTVAVYSMAEMTFGYCTTMQYPLIADVDGDGSAELIAIGMPGATHTADGSLNIFKSSTSSQWVPARAVWNQYMYNAVHINEDLTVPKQQINPAMFFPNGKQPYNNFLQQQTLLNKEGNPYWPMPNITWAAAPAVTVNGDSAVFNGCVTNTGSAALLMPVFVTYYKNDTISANIIAIDSISSSLSKDSTLCFRFAIRNLNRFAPLSSVWISVNDRNGVYPYQTQCMVNGRYQVNLTDCLFEAATDTNITVCAGSGVEIRFSAGHTIGNISVNGLPAGVTGSWNVGHDTFSISGTPTIADTYHYTLTPDSPCGASVISGVITVVPRVKPTITIKVRPRP